MSWRSFEPTEKTSVVGGKSSASWARRPGPVEAVGPGQAGAALGDHLDVDVVGNHLAQFAAEAERDRVAGDRDLLFRRGVVGVTDFGRLTRGAVIRAPNATITRQASDARPTKPTGARQPRVADNLSSLNGTSLSERGSVGRPSTRSPMMFRCTSSVPP